MECYAEKMEDGKTAEPCEMHGTCRECDRYCATWCQNMAPICLLGYMHATYTHYMISIVCAPFAPHPPFNVAKDKENPNVDVESYLSLRSGMLNNTSSHKCNNCFFSMFPFRDGINPYVCMASLMVPVR